MGCGSHRARASGGREATHVAALLAQVNFAERLGVTFGWSMDTPFWVDKTGLLANMYGCRCISLCIYLSIYLSTSTCFAFNMSYVHEFMIWGF